MDRIDELEKENAQLKEENEYQVNQKFEYFIETQQLKQSKSDALKWAYSLEKEEKETFKELEKLQKVYNKVVEENEKLKQENELLKMKNEYLTTVIKMSENIEIHSDAEDKSKEDE